MCNLVMANGKGEAINVCAASARPDRFKGSIDHQSEGVVVLSLLLAIALSVEELAGGRRVGVEKFLSEVYRHWVWRRASLDGSRRSTASRRRPASDAIRFQRCRRGKSDGR